NDLPILKRVGVAMCPADASDEIRAMADFVSARPGGHGAVREGIEMILAAKGLMARALALYDV
ncbi:MAG: 3-deoxy-D-manno-octulosonate 8-phosphate phosphatase, partial [Phycisphaerales bacterium JB061]